jgi:hypothetical protein
MNLIGVFPNLSRAYEIALLGGHSITVKYTADLFKYPKADEDYLAIKQYFNGVSFVADGDIWIEILNPKDYNRGEYSETLQDIHNRVNKAKDNPEPFQDYCEAGKELLKNTTSKLNFSLKDVQTIKKLSSTIAKLDGETSILTHRVAEAILYRIKKYWEHEVVVAENNTTQFGDKICIKRGEIHFEDAEKAINYLKKFV